MRKTYFYPLILSLFLLPMRIHAGTLENTDFKEYNVQITYDNGQITHEPLYEQSTSYICDYGCTLELMDTDQKIEMQPNDYIIIENGVFKRKEE